MLGFGDTVIRKTDLIFINIEVIIWCGFLTVSAHILFK